MTKDVASSIREIYDRLADEYARKLFYELQHKPLDRELLDRFACRVRDLGTVCVTWDVVRSCHPLPASIFNPC
jgi:hypothetical protein